MNAYSKDLRLKVLDAVERGVPRKEVSEFLGISISTISRYVRLKASGREIAPKPSPGRKAKILAPRTQEGALASTRRERHRRLGGASRDVGEGAGGLCIRDDDEPRGEKTWVVFQKRSLGASERDEQGRSAFREYVRSVVAERFVFVDESSTNISLSPIYARAPKGKRAYGKAPRNRGENISLISAIDTEGVKPSMSVEGAVDGKAFETYIKHFLAPELRRGQIVVMDNLSVHKSNRVEARIEEAGAKLLFRHLTRRTSTP